MRRGRRQTKDISTTDASAALPTKSVDASKSNQLQPAAKPFAGFGSFVKASPGSSAPAASTQKEQPKATLSFSKLAASSPAASPKDAAAKPTFSFSKPAVLPPTSSPSFSFGSETKTKPAASSPAASPAASSPAFSFADLPSISADKPTKPTFSLSKEPAAAVPPAEDEETKVPTAEEIAASSVPAKSESEEQFSVVPESFAAQLDVLATFYAIVDSAKTEADCKAIIDKRMPAGQAGFGTAGMSTLKFSKLCSTLAKKYGSNPLDGGVAPASASKSATAAAGTPKEVAPAAAPAASGWAKMMQAKDEAENDCSKWKCTSCYIKNQTEVFICIACEASKPGCEEEAKAAKAALAALKEAEKKESAAAAASKVAAAGISFGSKTQTTSFSFSKPAAAETAKPAVLVALEPVQSAVAESLLEIQNDETSEAAAKKKEISGLGVRQLRLRAAAAGADVDSIDDARDSDTPKLALMDLVVLWESMPLPALPEDDHTGAQVQSLWHSRTAVHDTYCRALTQTR